MQCRFLKCSPVLVHQQVGNLLSLWSLMALGPGVRLAVIVIFIPISLKKSGKAGSFGRWVAGSGQSKLGSAGWRNRRQLSWRKSVTWEHPPSYCYLLRFSCWIVSCPDVRMCPTQIGKYVTWHIMCSYLLGSGELC